MLVYRRVPPRKLTWKLNMMVSSSNLLFQGFIFRCHVSFTGNFSVENLRFSTFHPFFPSDGFPRKHLNGRVTLRVVALVGLIALRWWITVADHVAHGGGWVGGYPLAVWFFFGTQNSVTLQGTNISSKESNF